eukprot:CAMPEP_0119511062 /NCGR_PEP_ID=MMETSP1344-20130328/29834_1 /TAXON_ID=236787 /ORGANISM="Florenciella parvula, Strain CCMP2471" /LENGTH=200 /DNA_ID=CAMNT_0007548027 /DNA_START=16 /DNA_END=618 /DNA_ORIENTATION=+
MAAFADLPQLPDVPLRLLDDDSTETTLLALAEGRHVVIDFWTTRCERCPEALTKLNKFAEGWDQEALPTLFLSICCGNGTADDEEVGRDLAEEGEWYEMTHAYVATETKEMCKETFGFKSVPHYVVASKDGQVRFMGGVSKFSTDLIESSLTAAAEPAATTTAAAATDAVDLTDSPPKADVEPAAAPAAPAPAFSLDEDF